MHPSTNPTGSSQIPLSNSTTVPTPLSMTLGLHPTFDHARIWMKVRCTNRRTDEKRMYSLQYEGRAVNGWTNEFQHQPRIVSNNWRVFDGKENKRKRATQEGNKRTRSLSPSYDRKIRRFRPNPNPLPFHSTPSEVDPSLRLNVQTPFRQKPSQAKLTSKTSADGAVDLVSPEPRLPLPMKLPMPEIRGQTSITEQKCSDPLGLPFGPFPVLTSRPCLPLTTTVSKTSTSPNLHTLLASQLAHPIGRTANASTNEIPKSAVLAATAQRSVPHTVLPATSPLSLQSQIRPPALVNDFTSVRPPASTTAALAGPVAPAATVGPPAVGPKSDLVSFSLPCTHCGESLVSSSALAIHLQAHPGPHHTGYLYICGQCGGRFKNETIRRMHSKKPHNGRTFHRTL